MPLKENLKKFRRNQSLTQKQLAEKSGLSFSMVSKLESGEQTNPSFETLEKIAKALDINPGLLLDITVTIEESIEDTKQSINELQKKLETVTTPQQQEEIYVALELLQESYEDLLFAQSLSTIDRKNTLPSDFRNTDFNKTDEISECVAILKNRPEIQSLISTVKNATKEEIEQVIKLVETFKRN